MTDPASQTEKDVLTDYLEHFRGVLQAKCADLDAEQLATRSVPPSSMSLLGLVRHLAAVEQSWFRRVLDGHPELPRLWGKGERIDADFDDVRGDEGMVTEAWATWEHEVAFARQWWASCEDLSALVIVHDKTIPVRDVMVHLIEEYARHCGHADLLRECIDGRTG